MLPIVCMAQTRLVRGAVYGANNTPLVGAIVKSADTTQSVRTSESGKFEITVSAYDTYLVAEAEGYSIGRGEIDGSFVAIYLTPAKKRGKDAGHSTTPSMGVGHSSASATGTGYSATSAAAATSATAYSTTSATESSYNTTSSSYNSYATAYAAESSRNAKQDKIRDREEPIIKSTVEFSYLNDDEECFYGRFSNISLRYILTYNVMNLFDIGGGAGLNFYFDANEYATPRLSSNYPGTTKLAANKTSVPVFGYVRTNLRDKADLPYVALAAGVNIAPNKPMYIDDDMREYRLLSFFVNPQLGIELPVGSHRVNISAGAMCTTLPYFVINEDSSYYASYRYKAFFDFHVGFTF